MLILDQEARRGLLTAFLVLSVRTLGKPSGICQQIIREVKYESGVVEQQTMQRMRDVL